MLPENELDIDTWQAFLVSPLWQKFKRERVFSPKGYYNRVDAQMREMIRKEEKGTGYKQGILDGVLETIKLVEGFHKDMEDDYGRGQ